MDVIGQYCDLAPLERHTARAWGAQLAGQAQHLLEESQAVELSIQRQDDPRRAKDKTLLVKRTIGYAQG